jgi:hypothetical protein
VELGELLTVVGRDFKPDTDLEILLNRQLVGKARVRLDGTFAAVVAGPSELELATLTVREVATGRIVDGTSFLVRPRDEAERIYSPR